MDRVSGRDEVQRAQRVKTAISFYGAGDRGRRGALKSSPNACNLHCFECKSRVFRALRT